MYRVRATISGWQGGPGLYTAYFDASGGPTSAEASAVATRVRGAWDVFKTTMANATSLQVQGQVDVIRDTTGELITTFAVTPPAVVNSTSINGPGPAEVAGGLILDTGLVLDGRRFRGRSFFSPLPGSLTATVSPTTPLLDNINAFGVALIGASPPLATAPCVVWSRPRPGRAGFAAPVVVARASSKYWVIRSRRD